MMGNQVIWNAESDVYWGIFSLSCWSMAWTDTSPRPSARQFNLYVVDNRGWDPSWMWPCVACVIVAAVLLACMVKTTHLFLYLGILSCPSLALG